MSWCQKQHSCTLNNTGSWNFLRWQRLHFQLCSASLPAYFTGLSCLHEVEIVRGYQVYQWERSGLAGIAWYASTMMTAQVFLIVYLHWMMQFWSIQTFCFCNHQMFSLSLFIMFNVSLSSFAFWWPFMTQTQPTAFNSCMVSPAKWSSFQISKYTNSSKSFMWSLNWAVFAEKKNRWL